MSQPEREEWGRLFTDVAVWEPMVREICRRHGLGRGRQIEAGYPGSNAVFMVDHEVVVKIAAPFWQAALTREREVHALLAACAEVPAPRLLAAGVMAETRLAVSPEVAPSLAAGGLAEGWPYLVLEWLPGERIGAFWERIAPDNRHAIAARLGEMTRALHALPLTGLATLPAPAASWRHFVEGQLANAVAHHQERSLPAHLLAQLPGFLASVELLPPPDYTPRLLNADLTEDHVLLAESRGLWEITGWIDFGDAQAGDPEYEFVAAGLGALGGDPESMRRFLAAYGRERVDAAFNRRMLAWTLLHRFSDMQPYVERLGGPDRVRSLEELQAALWRV